MEQIGTGLKGIYRDCLVRQGGQVVHDSGWVSNTIVDNCRVLLAAFMHNDPQTPKPYGILGLAVGRGTEAWDQMKQLPKPGAGTLQLEYPYADSITIVNNNLHISYLDEQTAQPSVSCTSQLEITAILEPGYPNTTDGPAALREFGLYGMLGNTVYLINYVIHRVIYKAETDTLIRVIRLSF